MIDRASLESALTIAGFVVLVFGVTSLPASLVALGIGYGGRGDAVEEQLQLLAVGDVVKDSLRIGVGATLAFGSKGILRLFRRSR